LKELVYQWFEDLNNYEIGSFIYKEKSVEGGHECHSSTLDIVEPE
jgi:hypothetical protein